ncbi:LysR family transcriptional regulator [Desulfovibrio inopinatus]|uniref:LysR family transcriptional regulator n=1 Tax=Desulfovibrio inopinatus TaxID=102109 RepID=UPI00041B58C9|nr:LysR family transcriptional regulator [Desulfovibrio inopinatus]
MNARHLIESDLNLLVIFEAIYIERSLTRAGRRVNLTQSAVSHALSRLRDMFDDALFIRQGKHMEPTSLASGLYPDVSRALSMLESVVFDRDRFNPARSQREFTLGMGDYGVVVLLPSLLERIRRLAPGICLRIRQTTIENREELLSEGGIDALIGIEQPYGRHIRYCRLLEDRDVLIVRRGHPEFKEGITKEQYQQAEFISLCLKDSSGDPLDMYVNFGRAGRNIVLTIEQETLIPKLVAGSDCIAHIGERVARECIHGLPLNILPVPLPDTRFMLNLYWNAAQERDPGNMWLREQIKQIAQEITATEKDTLQDLTV